MSLLVVGRPAQLFLCSPNVRHGKCGKQTNVKKLARKHCEKCKGCPAEFKIIRFVHPYFTCFTYKEHGQMCPEISKVVSCHIFQKFCQKYAPFSKSCHIWTSSYRWLKQGSFGSYICWFVVLNILYRYPTNSLTGCCKIFVDHISKTFSTSTTRRRLLLSNSARRRFAWKLWTNFWQIISRHFLCTARKYKIPK